MIYRKFDQILSTKSSAPRIRISQERAPRRARRRLRNFAQGAREDRFFRRKHP